MSPTNLALMAAFAVLVFWAVGAYNRLIRLKNSIGNSFGPIDVQLKQRYDLISGFVEAVKSYLQHEQERDMLDAVMTVRNLARSASDAVRSRPANARVVRLLASTERKLGRSLARLFAVAKLDPRLRADKTICALRDDLRSAESKVVFACQAYNDAVRVYNQAQGQFPVLLLARLFGFSPAALLKTTQKIAGP